MNNETIADILREVRTVNPHNEIADRIEAAHKRELATTKDSLAVGNGAKVCEALLEAKRTLQYLYRPERASFEGDNRRIVDTVRIIDAALAAPPRNCDVGTGEEQTLRFHDFCESHKVPFDPSRGTICAGAKCPAYNNDANCFFIWAQLPYKKEGAE